MSRYWDDYDGETFPNQFALWENATKRALNSKRGRQALADLREALLALPEPKLIEGALCTVSPGKRSAAMSQADWAQASWRGFVDDHGEGVCAVGAYIWYQKIKAGIGLEEAFDALPTLRDEDSELWETAKAGRAAGLAITLAWDLAYRNDERFRDCTPEERHAKFVGWIDEQLAAGDAA